MNVFIQGMRRSGTTILYDILCQDREFAHFYEPFAAPREGVLGGGSGVQAVDLFESVRRVRRQFQALHPEITEDMLNYGGPGHPLLEFEPDLPSWGKEYLRLMIAPQGRAVIKFTRMYCKIVVLKEIDPEAKLVLVVRDPRAVVTSYLFGLNRRYQSRYREEADFFGARTGNNSWKLRDFSDHLLAIPENGQLAGCEDFIRVLLLWKFTFEQTYTSGRSSFGPNFLLLRHEDLIREPEQTLIRLYDLLGRPLPGHLVPWALGHVREQQAAFAPESQQWRRAFARMDMARALEQAGYRQIMEGGKGGGA